MQRSSKSSEHSEQVVSTMTVIVSYYTKLMLSIRALLRESNHSNVITVKGEDLKDLTRKSSTSEM